MRISTQNPIAIPRFIPVGIQEIDRGSKYIGLMS